MGFFTNKQRQSGVALITAMIITMIAVSLAATVMYRQQIQIRLSSNIGHLEQAYLYANGMEDWAGTILKKSWDEHPKYDSLEDDWATGGQLISLPIDGGVMNGQLFDLQALININSLARPKPPKPEKTTPDELNPDGTKKGVPPNKTLTPEQIQAQKEKEEKERKPYIAEITRERLMNLLGIIDPDQTIGPPENFLDVLKDWLDTDQTNGNKEHGGDSTGTGAESPYYQSLEPAYFSADTLMVSPTELRLLKEMDKEIYKELIKYVTTLPIGDLTSENKIETPINVNTASKQVLQSIGFDPGTADDIIKERKIQPFESMKSGVLASSIQLMGDAVNPNDLDVKSSYFLLKGSVNINNARLFINSVLERKNGQVSVIMRDFSNP